MCAISSKDPGVNVSVVNDYLLYLDCWDQQYIITNCLLLVLPSLILRRKCGETNMSLHMFIRKCHWLPVKQRIVYKLCLIVHKCLHGIAPTTLKATLTYCQSSLMYKLIQKDYKRSFGNRSFARIAPKLWNALPLELRKEKTTDIFKKLLKTHLFDNAMEYHRKCEHT